MKKNNWKRKWWWYECVVESPFHTLDGHRMVAKRKLNFIAYYLILKLHGEKKLIELCHYP